jgi:crotonobetainyl-CoA:carnitine CoA-transferase CaiB-like acyl-CoA transferase
MAYQVSGDAMTRPFGAGRALYLPAGYYQCADGWVVVATAPRWVPRMLATLGDPGLNEYFAAHPDAAYRPETTEVLAAPLNRWLAAHGRLACFEQAVLAHGWPVFPVNQPGDVLADPHFAGRGYFLEADHPVAGHFRQPGAPWRMGDGGFENRRPAPLLGQDNQAVYGDELGVDPAELSQARTLGVI